MQRLSNRRAVDQFVSGILPRVDTYCSHCSGTVVFLFHSEGSRTEIKLHEANPLLCTSYRCFLTDNQAYDLDRVFGFRFCLFGHVTRPFSLKWKQIIMTRNKQNSLQIIKTGALLAMEGQAQKRA